MKHSGHIKSHDLDLIASKVQNWWEECERDYRDADGDPIDWEAYFALNELRVEMVLREMLWVTHPDILRAGGFRPLAIELIDKFDEELHPQMYYIEYGVAAVHEWIKAAARHTP